MTELLHTKDLHIGYTASKGKAYEVAGPVDLHFKPGEIVALVGPNGSGKSTLLKTITGLLKPIAGEIFLGNESITQLSLRERARRMALVTTHFGGAHAMTGFDSVALGRSPHSGWLDRLTEHDREVVQHSMESTDSTHLATRFVDELSDGERQRLAIARALAQEASLILLDEPTAFLDLPHRVGLLGLLRNLCRSKQVGVILSTHDLDLAMRFADRMLVLDGKGHVEYDLPEALALQGVFSRVFSTQDVFFDMKHGSFHFAQLGCIQVAFKGQGLVADWTRRALRRKGWIIDDVQYPLIEVCEDPVTPSWQISANANDQKEVYNLEALLDWLSKIRLT